jgi:hypothetical protein
MARYCIYSVQALFNSNGWANYDTERSRGERIEATYRRSVSSTTVTAVESDTVDSIRMI